MSLKQNTSIIMNSDTESDMSFFRPQLSWVFANSSAEALDRSGFLSTFRFLTYNVLAQALIKREFFSSSSIRALKWRTRRSNLLSELQLYQADVMCLQELDNFEEFYRKNLTSEDLYDVHWTRQPNRQHGCAIFWRKKYFELVAAEDFFYDDDAIRLDPQVGEESSCDRAELMRGNVAQIVALKFRKGRGDQSDGIVVFNTHLFWNPSYHYVRLVQIHAALSFLLDFKSRVAPSWPAVIGGDYNDVPTSPLFRVMCRHEALPALLDSDVWLTPATQCDAEQAGLRTPSWRATSDEDAAQADREKRIRLKRVHRLLSDFIEERLPELVSAYRDYRLLDPEADYAATQYEEEGPYTNFTLHWRGTLDYILTLSRSHPLTCRDTIALYPIRLLAIPKVDQLVADPGLGLACINALPNDVRGSDHIPLMVEFGAVVNKSGSSRNKA